MASNLFHKKLLAKIEDQKLKRQEYLANGYASDYPNYREAVGYLQGLNDVIKLCDDIEQENQ